jgi:hypothetical protein
LGKFWRAFEWSMLVYFWPFVIFYGHCAYFTAFWSSLWSFGIFSQFGMFGPRKIWQPWLRNPLWKSVRHC